MKLTEAFWWTALFVGLLLSATALTIVNAIAQIPPNWSANTVLTRPGSPSPADQFRHHCPPRFKYNVRYRRCMPLGRRGGAHYD
jgi:hypothetical protein